MSRGWQRRLGVGAVSLALAGAPIIGAPALAWADAATPSPTLNVTNPAASSAGPVASSATDPNPAASTTGPSPRGCVGVTPKKPWRLVASRPDPTASAVHVEWSAVGCTTGYRVSIVGAGVDRQVDIAGGTTSSLDIPDLSPGMNYHVTVTSIGTNGDGGVSGDFGLHRSGPSARADLTIDFPDAGPTAPVAASLTGAGPWVNPELTWTAPAGPEPASYRVRVVRGGGAVVEKTVPGTATKARLGDEVVAGVAYSVTLTPIMADGSEGSASRLSFGNRQAPRPEQVTGNAPVVQFSPVTDQQEGRVLGYEIGFGALQASKHVFVPAPSAVDAAAPWVAVDPSFAAVDASETAVPMSKMVAVVRTITTMGKSAWTPAETITHSEVATADASYFAGIGHIAGRQDTVPRNGFLNVHGSAADLQVTDLVWSQSPREQDVPVSLAVYGPAGSGSPAFTQDVPVTHLPDAAQDAWRASDIPLPDGWTSVVLRRGGADVARWVNTGGRPCVAAVTFGDAPTDLPAMWKDSWCTP
jgi:hypothetical protein